MFVHSPLRSKSTEKGRKPADEAERIFFRTPFWEAPSLPRHIIL
jgi:hypothetical protein